VQLIGWRVPSGRTSRPLPTPTNNHIVPALTSLSDQAMRAGVVTFAAQGVRFLIRIVTQIAIGRLLLPADYGLIAMVAPVLALVQLVADLGLGQVVIQRSDISQSDVSSLFWIGITTNVGIALLLAILAPAIAWIYQEPRLLSVSLALAALVPVSGLFTQPAAMLSRDMRFRALAIVDVLTPFAGLTAGFAAAWCGLGYWALIVSMAAESVSAPMLVWSASAWRPSFPALEPSALSLVRVGGHITGFNLAQFVTSTFDNVLLAFTQGEAALGLYDKGYKTVTGSMGQLIAPVNRIAVPLLVRLLPDPDRYRRSYLGIVQVMFLAGAPAILFVCVMSNFLMPVLLGSQWTGIAPVISWLCLGSLASPLYASTYWLFVSQGRVRRQLAYGMITSVISIAGFVAGLPWGPVGVAAGAGISFCLVSTPLTCLGATRVGPVSFRDILLAMLPVVAAGSATATTLTLLSEFVPRGNVVLLSGLPLSYGMFVVILCGLASGRQILQRIWNLISTLTHSNNPSTREAEVADTTISLD